MKTLREMMDIVEGATVDYEVEWTDRNTGEQGITSVSALTQHDAEKKVVKIKLQQGDNIDVTDVFPARKQNPVAEGQTTRTCPQCDGSGEDTLDPTKSCRRCDGKGHIPMSPKKQEVDEAIGRKDLISRLQKDLPRIDDPKNKDAESVKWTGPGKDDYGYTGYQGHGMPTDKQERDRIRADKKKGVAEDSEAHRLGSQAAARGRPYSTNPYPAGSKNHLEWSQAHNSIRARRAQEVDEQATPEAVAKINSLFSK
jgi:hypothetical protein